MLTRIKSSLTCFSHFGMDYSYVAIGVCTSNSEIKEDTDAGKHDRDQGRRMKKVLTGVTLF